MIVLAFLTGHTNGLLIIFKRVNKSYTSVQNNAAPHGAAVSRPLTYFKAASRIPLLQLNCILRSVGRWLSPAGKSNDT